MSAFRWKPPSGGTNNPESGRSFLFSHGTLKKGDTETEQKLDRLTDEEFSDLIEDVLSL